ncbi:MAG: hypothetical protein OXU69_07610 [Gemmatimonadota bacterium]|nr:hypothetical protein [Gemmatimonadota bacterium]
MTTPDAGGEPGKAVHREQLFGPAVATLDRPELLLWLRKYTNEHSNPAGTHAREARRWLLELEHGGGREAG